MTDSRINIRILNGLKRQTEDDEAIHEFLVDLIYDEVEHPGHWQWKGIYTAKLREASAKWSGPHED
jgi:hypothetical protein